MGTGNTITGLVGIISFGLAALQPNEKRQNSKIIRKAFKNLKKIRKIMRKNDGVIDAKEQLALNEILFNIVEAQNDLLEF